MAANKATTSDATLDGDIDVSDIRGTDADAATGPITASPGSSGVTPHESGGGSDGHSDVHSGSAGSATLSATATQGTPVSPQESRETPSEIESGTRTRKRRATMPLQREATTTSTPSTPSTPSKSSTPNKTIKNKNKKAKTNTTRGPSDAHILFGPSREVGPSNDGPSNASPFNANPDAGPSRAGPSDSDETKEEDHWPRIPDRLRPYLQPSGEDPLIATPPSAPSGTGALAELLNPAADAGFNVGTGGEPSGPTRSTRHRERRHVRDYNDNGSVYWHRSLPEPIRSGPPGLPATWSRQTVQTAQAPQTQAGGDRPLAPLPRRVEPAITPETAPPHPFAANGYQLTRRGMPRAYRTAVFEGGRRVNQFWTEMPRPRYEYARYDLHGGPPPLGGAGPSSARFGSAETLGGIGGPATATAGPGPSTAARFRSQTLAGRPNANVHANVHAGPAALGHGQGVAARRFADDFGAPFGGVTGLSSGGFGGFGGLGGFGDGYAPTAGMQVLSHDQGERDGHGFTGLASPMRGRDRFSRRLADIANLPADRLTNVPGEPSQQRAGPSWVSTPTTSTTSVEVEVEIAEVGVEEDELASDSDSDSSVMDMSDFDDRDDHDDHDDPSPGAGGAAGGTGSVSGNSGHDGQDGGWGDFDRTSSYSSSEVSYARFDRYFNSGTIGTDNDAMDVEPALSSVTTPIKFGPATATDESETGADGKNVKGKTEVDDKHAVVAAIVKNDPLTLGMEAQLLAILADLPRYNEKPSDTELAAVITHRDVVTRRRSARLHRIQTEQAEKAVEQLMSLQAPPAGQGLLNFATVKPDIDSKDHKDNVADNDKKEDKVDKEKSKEKPKEHWLDRLPRRRSRERHFDVDAHAAVLHEKLLNVWPTHVRARLTRTHSYAVCRRNDEVEGYENYPGAWRIVSRSAGIEIRRKEMEEQMKENKGKNEKEEGQKEAKEKVVSAWRPRPCPGSSSCSSVPGLPGRGISHHIHH